MTDLSFFVFVFIFIAVIVLLSIIAIRKDKRETLGELHIYKDESGAVAFYVEFFEDKGPDDLLKNDTVAFKIKEDISK